MLRTSKTDKYIIVNANGVRETSVVQYIAANPHEKEYIYVGPAHRYTQVLLAKACKIHKRKLSIFTPPVEGIFYPTMAKSAYPQLELHEFGNLAEAINASNAYKLANPDAIFWVNQHIPHLAKLVNLPAMKTCWITFGTGPMLSALLLANPQTKFLCVSQRHQIDQEDYQEYWDRIVPYYAHMPKPMSYASNSYEGKMWIYISEFGQQGDYIWSTDSPRV